MGGVVVQMGGGKHPPPPVGGGVNKSLSVIMLYIGISPMITCMKSTNEFLVAIHYYPYPVADPGGGALGAQVSPSSVS